VTHDAVIYDLDGTLVRLTVDWAAVADDVRAVYADAGETPPSDGLWELLERAGEYDLREEVEAAIAAREREGARASDRLPLADDLADGPVGVCSLNCEAACRIALAEHGLTDRVSTVIGRDSVATHKPDPEPLVTALEALGVAPEDGLFVGDSERDLRTAEAAGVPFEYVDGAPSDH